MKHDLSTPLSPDETSLTALVPIWDSGEETLVFPASGQFNCGSHRDSAAKISLKGVADRHCRLLCRNGEVRVEPFGQHEVRVNDAQVFGSHPLNTGDQLAIGPATFRVERRRAGLMSRVNINDRGLKSPVSATAQPETPTSAKESTEDSITRKMADLERRLAEAQAMSAAPALPPDVPSMAFGMPVLAGASQDNRRRLLDAREAQLTEWQSSLELRCVELDNRSTTLARQQALLSERQLEIEKRAKELENWQQETARTMRVQNEQATEDARRELQQQREELLQRDEQLSRERAELEAQSRRLEESKQTVAARMEELSEARRTLAHERSEYLREQKSVAADIEHRESALHNQQQELAVRAENVSDLEAERAEVNRLSHQLEAQEADLVAREAELSELELFRDELAERESALKQLQQELDVAAIELQHLESVREDVKTGTAELELLSAQIEPQLATVAELEKLRDEVAEREWALQARQTELQEEADGLAAAAKEVATEWQRIEQTRAELTDADEKIKGLRLLQEEHATRQAQLNLHQEELNTLSADLEARSAALETTEESLTTRATELQELAQKLAEQEAEITVQRDELAKTSAEAEELEALRAKLEEQEAASNQQTATLTQELDELRRTLEATRDELAAAAEVPVDDSTIEELTELKAELVQAQQSVSEQQQLVEDVRLEFANVTAERDELSMAVSELRTALEATRDEISAAAPADSDDSSTQIAELQVQLEERERELLNTRATVEEQQQLTETLKEQLLELTDSFAAEREKIQEEAIAQATSDLSAGDVERSDDSLTEYREMIEQLTKTVEEQEGIIASLQNSSSETSSITDEDAKILHRELDERTNLLDSREEALREQQRMVEQSAGEIEQQRRAMLEARQQLELARAEIQVASHRHDSVMQSASAAQSASDVQIASVVDEEQFDGEFDEPEMSSDSVPAVRSEIAELFGLAKGGGVSSLPALEPVKEPNVSTAAELMAAVDDYSQEQAAAVSMKFSDAGDVLLAAVHEEEVSTGEDFEEPEDAHDDFVSQYMEQLLSRNREGAGGALPSELTKQKAPEKAAPAAKAKAAPAPEKPKAPGQVSFIEQYMSGAYGDSESSEAVVDQETAEETEPAKPAAPRTKVDVEAMRRNMNSFRELSTKSVENALATHAKRQRRGGIANRSTLCLALGVVCVLMVSASLIGFIPFGIFTWLSIAAAGLAVGDLMLKMGKSNRSGDRTEEAEHVSVDRPQVALHQPQPEVRIEDSEKEEPEKDDEYFEI